MSVETQCRIRRYKALREMPGLAARLAYRWEYAADTSDRLAVRGAVQEVRPASHACWLTALIIKHLQIADPSSASWFIEFMKPEAEKKPEPRREPFHSVRRRGTKLDN